MKKFLNSKMIQSVALAIIFANTMPFALAQEQEEAAIAPPPAATWEVETPDANVAPPPPSNQVINNFSQRLREAERRAPRPLRSYKAGSNFARRAYQDRLDVCVNAIAQACDGHFTKKLTRALSRGTRDLVDGVTLANALRAQGLTRCGHYFGETGAEREMEAFTKLNQLILFSPPSAFVTPAEAKADPNKAKCLHSVIALPESIVDMKVTQNRVYLVGASRAVYYAGADFKVRKTDKFATSTTLPLLIVSPDGSKISVTGPAQQGFFDANSLKSSVLVGGDHKVLGFSDDPRVSDAAATLIPFANSFRK